MRNYADHNNIDQGYKLKINIIELKNMKEIMSRHNLTENKKAQEIEILIRRYGFKENNVYS